MTTINRLNELLKEGKEILKTKYDPNFAEDGVITIGFKVTVNDLKFTKWQSKTIVFLEKILKPDDFRLIKFKEEVKTNYYNDTKIGVGILESLVEDIESNDFKENTYEDNYELEPYYFIESILNNFHEVVKTLSKRNRNRDPLIINDEYDVQYLLHSLLFIHFKDIREEDPTPNNAGKSTKVDFLIKDCNTVIETKMMRETLDDGKVGSELILDIQRYSKHPSCDTLYCFIYDPKGYIRNSEGLKNDLEDIPSEIEVKVIICP